MANQVLTDYEEEFVTRYMEKHNLELTQFNFYLALDATVPRWRSEQLLQDVIDNGGTQSYAYTCYALNLVLDKLSKSEFEA